MRAHRGRVRKHAGFTLVELVVVVMILGILAAVAAPKLMGTSKTATENSVKHTLGVIRDAIERYAADHGGTLPGNGSNTMEVDLTTKVDDYGPYLRGGFPKCPVAGQKNTVEAVSAGGALSASSDDSNGSWKYSTATGEFIVNSDALLSDEVTKYSDL